MSDPYSSAMPQDKPGPTYPPSYGPTGSPAAQPGAGYPPVGVSTWSSAPATANSSTRGLIVAGFVLSFLIPLAGLIMCIVGKSRAKKDGTPAGLATAGIIVAVAVMVLGAAMGAIIAAMSATTPVGY